MNLTNINSLESLEQKVIEQLSKKTIDIFDIPKEIENNKAIIEVERKLGYRTTKRIGFDIISYSYFVEEILSSRDGETLPAKTTFKEFTDYYNYLDGKIYDNACYKYLDTSKIDKLCDFTESLNSFTNETVDDFKSRNQSSVSADNSKEWQSKERRKKLLQKNIKNLDMCNSFEEFFNLISKFRKSKLSEVVDVTFYFYNYIFKDTSDINRFNIVMQYISTGYYPTWKIINTLCSIYNPDDVIKSLSYKKEYSSRTAFYNRRNKLKSYVAQLKKGAECATSVYFDTETHYYYEETYVILKGPSFPYVYRRYFPTFAELVEYRNGNLFNCDFSNNPYFKFDLSSYKTDSSTILPSDISDNSDNADKALYSVQKKYHNGKFQVIQEWGSWRNKQINEFDYFFDFTAFLKNDLSNADLITCDGLKNLNEWENINFKNAKLTSELCDKFGIKYKHINKIGAVTFNQDFYPQDVFKTSQTSLIINDDTLPTKHDISNEYDKQCQEISYITDIHLMHKLVRKNCKSENDVLCVIRNITSAIVKESKKILLIGGDVSSNYDIFKLFVKELYDEIASAEHYYGLLSQRITVIFIIGNHEFWSFNNDINTIMSKYKRLLSRYNMFLLSNSLLYTNDYIKYEPIDYDTLSNATEKKIINRLRYSKLVIFGGTGFSKYNSNFNANNGIYGKSITRETEISESEKFEKLYNKLSKILTNFNSIILTHMPKCDWCSNGDYDGNLVYVSGHTHRDVFYDDGYYRIYSDNQVGYYLDTPTVKSLLIEKAHDCFFDYSDDIYTLTRDKYIKFYQSQNIRMRLNRDLDTIYMLKKNSYYCFICKSKKGTLGLLNGGAYKNLKVNDIQYYYKNMDYVINVISKPLNQYTLLQRKVSNAVRSIGGSGTIHGCIIDIDFYNHIYINPFDFTITGYSAFDIKTKVVFPSIEELIKSERSELLGKLNDQQALISPITNDKNSTSPQLYLSTDIYKISREIKKMQKLHSHILSTWFDTQEYPNTPNTLHV